MPDQQRETDRKMPVRCRLRLLGPVQLIGPAGRIDLPGELRELIALLGLRTGERVSVAELAEALAAPPHGLAERVRRLATTLTNAGLPEALADGPDGYLLRLPDDAVDAQHFTTLLTRARQQMAANELVRASELLTAALALWPTDEPTDTSTGPLDDVPPHPSSWAAATVRQLGQLRISAIEERWECVLALAAEAVAAAGGPVADRAVVAAGDAGTRSAALAVAELENAVTRHPLRARLWELLLLAAFLSAGRGAAAEVERRARQVFRDQLGVEPGARLRLLAASAQRGDLADRWREQRGDPTGWWAGGLADRWAGPPGPRPGGAAPRLDPVRPRDTGALPDSVTPPTDPPAGDPARPLRPRLPVPLTALLGRDELLAEVDRLLNTYGLVTLTGPGGAGKTRLAVAVSHRTAAAGTWFVDLSAVQSPVRVPEAVAAVLGVRQEPGRDLVETLTGELGTATGLLILDNCEHLVAGCAELIGRLLSRCPGLRVLATSRTALRLPGEAVVPVPTLAAPRPGTCRTVGDLVAHPATRLFLERAQARSGQPLTGASVDTVARICAELDGLPLAIELAAARVPSLGPREILHRLQADLRLLRSPDPTVPSRHRTLAAAVESSVQLLGPGARTLFERLGVVTDGFDAETAWALVGPPAPAALAELVAASLVEPAPVAALPDEAALLAGPTASMFTTPPPGEPVASVPAPVRYRMLVPIRRHALSRLAETGGEAAARQAYASHCLDLAERADARLRGAGQENWLHRLRTEAANLRATMRWLAEAGAGGPPHGDLRLATALATYCRLEGNYREGRTWLAEALARHPEAPARLRGRAGTGAAMLAMLLCDYATAAEHAEAARKACREAGDRRGEARVELTLGSVARERARYAESSAHLAVAAALFAEAGDEWGEAQTVLLRGFTAWLSGDLERADSRLRSGLRRCERLGDPEAVATVLMHLGAVAHYRGDADRAGALLDAALQRYATLGLPEGVGWAHNLRGLVELRARRTDRAAAHLAVSLVTYRKVGDRWRTASVLEALAELARLDRAGARAAQLLGAAGRVRAEIGAPVPECERPEVEATGRALRAELGETGFEAAYRHGQATTLDSLLPAISRPEFAVGR